jgi:hypothetical protein
MKCESLHGGPMLRMWGRMLGHAAISPRDLRLGLYVEDDAASMSVTRALRSMRPRACRKRISNFRSLCIAGETDRGIPLPDGSLHPSRQLRVSELGGVLLCRSN